MPTKLRDWAERLAFPLWSGPGFDPDTGTVWEELDHGGAPLREMPKRLRVQARQAYCFARWAEGRYLPLAETLFRSVMDRGFEGGTGNLASRLSPGGQIETAPHDLYDIAFVLLAASALHRRGVAVSDDLAALDQALARLKAPRGWHQNAARSLPRGQNPHMHLFEAATALFATTHDPTWRQVADECLSLFHDHFFQPDGRIAEFFRADWTPVPKAEQATEPGHMAEWIYLLNRYEVVCNISCGADLPLLLRAVLARRDGTGLLPDTSDPPGPTRRLWGQTELLKAVVVMQSRGTDLPEEARPVAVMQKLWDGYLDVPTPGGWYDKRGTDGRLISATMPASSFYHVLEAISVHEGWDNA